MTSEVPGVVPPPLPAAESMHIEAGRRSHVLDGELKERPDGRKKYFGGHRSGTGFPSKSEFPARWSDDEVMTYVVATARNPETVVYRPATPFREEQQWRCEAWHDDVQVVSIVRSGGTIWTSWPEQGRGVVRNPRS